MARLVSPLKAQTSSSVMILGSRTDFEARKYHSTSHLVPKIYSKDQASNFLTAMPLSTMN